VVQDAKKTRKAPLGGLTGIAVGAGLAAAAPLAVKGVSKLKNGLGGGGNLLEKPVEKAGGKLKGAASDVVDKKVKDAGGPGGMVKDAAKSVIPGVGGGDDGDSSGDSDGGSSGNEPGVGKGRRMPIQQAVDVPVPVKTAYNQFTQFEEWPNFMHRVTNVSQEDETHVSFKTKIWGFSREFTAEIEEQRPDERIQWTVADGIVHNGVVTFHELADRLTRIEVNVDLEPSGLIEKSARGMRHVKRAIRADLHRYKAYTVMHEEEDGEWRGTVEDGEVKQTRSRSSAASKSSNGRSTGSRSGEKSGSAKSSGSKSAAKSSGSRSNAKSSGSKSSGSRSNARSGGSRSGSSRSSSSGRSKAAGSSSKRTTSRSRSSNGGDPAGKSSSSRSKSGSRS
jgi:uncharacterized membrane protein